MDSASLSRAKRASWGEAAIRKETPGLTPVVATDYKEHFDKIDIDIFMVL